MANSLSDNQKQILNFRHGLVTVKACPGSGKTYSVAARIAMMLSERDFIRKGIAALSFTNVACDEINDKLKSEFNIKWFGTHPHFLGTIDSFINRYIFLPFGHLVMGCNKRPELVGKPYSHWTKGKGERRYFKGQCVGANPDEFFDCTTFDITDTLIPIVPNQLFPFSWKKYYNQDGSVFKKIRDIIDVKKKFFKEGYANQSDANYHALKVLQKYPLIAESVAHQFDYFIIDEAQDTDEVQMAIIEILNSKGASNIMLVGDRDQSIFEWNDATPELFDKKYDEWGKIHLSENRRSSRNICNVIQNLSTFQRIFAVNPEVVNYDYLPEIVGFKLPSISKTAPVTEFESKKSLLPSLQYFFALCEQHGIEINKSNVAVLYRGNAFGRYLDINRDIYDHDKIPWIAKNYHVRDIVRGKFLFENGIFDEAYKILEKGYLEGINKTHDPSFYCNSEFIKQHIEKTDFKLHREEVFRFVNCLPRIDDLTLRQWIQKSNQKLTAAGYNFTLSVINANSDVAIKDLFAGDVNKNDLHKFSYGTIHSAKGKTFEAVLLLVGKKPGNKSAYKKILEAGPKPGEEEELRNIYVAISRPRKILMIAVPNEDISVWKRKLKIK